MIDIKVIETFTKRERLLPESIFSKPHGEVYEIKSSNTSKDKPSYLVACGINEGAMLIWWSDEDKTYQIAPADLNGYANHIYVERVECDISVTLTLGGRNEA